MANQILSGKALLRVSICFLWLLAAVTVTLSAQESQTGTVDVKLLLERAREIQADPTKEAYAGWMDYLASQIEEKQAILESVRAKKSHFFKSSPEPD